MSCRTIPHIIACHSGKYFAFAHKLVDDGLSADGPWALGQVVGVGEHFPKGPLPMMGCERLKNSF